MPKKNLFRPYFRLLTEPIMGRDSQDKIFGDGSDLFVNEYRLFSTKGKPRLKQKPAVPLLHPFAPSLRKVLPCGESDVDPQIIRLIKKNGFTDPQLRLRRGKDITRIYVIYKMSGAIDPAEWRYIKTFQTLLAANRMIKKKIIKSAAKCVSEREIRAYIGRQRVPITQLIESIFRETGALRPAEIFRKSTAYDGRAKLMLTYMMLDRLLCFIQDRFGTYCDGFPISTTKSLKDRALFMNFARARAALRSHDIGPNFQALILSAFGEIADLWLGSRTTFYRYRYLCDHAEHLSEPHAFTDDIHLLNLLLKSDFNSLALFDAMTNIYAKDFSRYDDCMEGIDYLSRQLKTVNQLQNRAARRYETDLPPAKVQIAGWLEEEIAYQRGRIQHQSLRTGQVLPEEANKKLSSRLSVAQLSYMFNLLGNVGIIEHGNQRDIFRFISANFKTKLADDISVDSIKSKYYNVESGTRAAVRAKMIEILNLTKG